VTQTYLSPRATTVLFASREASAAGRLRSNGLLARNNFRFARHSGTIAEVTERIAPIRSRDLSGFSISAVKKLSPFRVSQCFLC